METKENEKDERILHFSNLTRRDLINYILDLERELEFLTLKICEETRKSNVKSLLCLKSN